MARGLKDILETTLGSKVFTTLGPVDGEPDVILYDVIGLLTGDGADLDLWVKRTGAMVIAMTHDHRPDLGALALERGCAGAVRLSVSPDDLVGVVTAILSGAFPDNPVVREAVDATRLGYARRPEHARGRRAAADRPRPQQPGDQRASLRVGELDQDLHPQRLPQDRRRQPCPGRRLGDRERRALRPRQLDSVVTPGTRS